MNTERVKSHVPRLDVRRLFAHTGFVGYSRRKEARELVEIIDEANRRIDGLTPGTLWAGGTVFLEVACYGCPRQGLYRLTRLIDRHGPTMLLSKLAEILSADCPNRRGDGYFMRCGVYFPDAKRGSDVPPRMTRTEK